MMNLREYRNRTAGLADFLPWAALIAPGVILNKDGSFQRSARFRGPDMDSATPAELVGTTARLNNALRRLGSGWAIFVEAMRRPALDYPVGDFPDPASALVDLERAEQFAEEGAHFESAYFLTLLWMPPAEDAARAETWLYEGRSQAGVDARELVTGFVDRSNRVLQLVEGFVPEVAWLDDAETLTYLHSTVSTKAQHVRVPETPMHLDALLADEPLAGGLEPRLGTSHLRTLTVIGFPSVTFPGLLDEMMGGDWQDLGTSLHDGDEASVLLQPLARIDEAAERAWAAEWLAAILGSEGVAVDPQAKEHLWSALSSLATAPVAERTLTGLAVLLQAQPLKQALAPYCVGGPFGQLLDAESERLGDARIQAFETEGLTGSGAAAAVLSYLFHRIEGRLDGSPTLIIIDEGWLVLDSPAFAAQLREWLKTLRKKNASMVFATQSLADIETSSITPAIIESCPTRIFLPNERAIEPQIMAIYRRFGLNDRQIEILSRATPKRDYYCQSRRGNRLFELGLGDVALAFTAASSKTDQLHIAELVKAHGADGFADAWLRHRGVGWAADLLRTATDFPTPAKELLS
jgi:type IV secretory pathway VirB4 component